MKNRQLFSLLCFLFCTAASHGQYRNRSTLTIEQIMKGDGFTGHLPDRVFWSVDSKTAYFRWNPDGLEVSPLYAFNPENDRLEKAGAKAEFSLPPRTGSYNKDKSKYLYLRDGDMILLDVGTGRSRKLMTNREDIESVQFASGGTAVAYTIGHNLVKWDLENGEIEQLTGFNERKKNDDHGGGSKDSFLEKQQQELFLYIRKKKVHEAAEKEHESLKPEEKKPRKIPLGNKSLFNLRLSRNDKYISYSLFERNNAQRTEIMEFVTESGYSQSSRSRSKVGSSYGKMEFYIYNMEKDTVFGIDPGVLPGISELPEFKSEYGISDTSGKERDVTVTGLFWSDDGRQAVANIRSLDNKDRWIVMMDPETGTVSVLERQHDEAWLDGPGIGWTYSSGTLGWLPDNRHIYFQSEESGYSHLYVLDVKTMKKTALTKGRFEVYDPMPSLDGKSWYFSSNQADPGERQFYRMPITGGKPVRLTGMEGRNDVTLSPDEKTMIIRHSYTNKPWELYFRENKENARAVRITDSYSAEFSAYPWRDPDIIHFRASDGVMVRARLYSPDAANRNGAGIIFVHGAGYLQNVHKWWSSYSREYMFHNFLADNGYTVLDIDYRGSAGYGRDWRTAIYRHMGGRDLEDQVDGARWLNSELGIDSSRIGIYGGSYGGFITLMAMFTKPGVFAAGAALRPVTDWAHYNNGYTSNILNTPQEDSLAYQRSSPIYFAEGLAGPLLICHGMVDDNVHFQDVVRLAQRLIELGKDDWELAPYPVERHSFTQPSSWTDEYKRIYKLFEENLNPDERGSDIQLKHKITNEALTGEEPACS